MHLTTPMLIFWLSIIFLSLLPYLRINIALYVFALRMRIILSAFGASISGFQAQRIHLQSIFYYFSLPMTVGLEVSRYAKIKALLGSDVRSFNLASALLADRIVGFLSAIGIAAILFPVGAATIVPKLDSKWIFLAVIFLAATITVWLLRQQILSGLRKIVVLPRASWRWLLLAFVISFTTHAFFACAVFAGSVALSLDISVEQTFFAVCSAMLFVIFPVSFAGVSPVEAASFGLALALGLPNEQAVLFAVIVYFLKLFAAAEGACWELVDGGRAFMALLEARPPN